jgi:hypothetical protein
MSICLLQLMCKSSIWHHILRAVQEEILATTFFLKRSKFLRDRLVCRVEGDLDGVRMSDVYNVDDGDGTVHTIRRKQIKLRIFWDVLPPLSWRWVSLAGKDSWLYTSPVFYFRPPTHLPLARVLAYRHSFPIGQLSPLDSYITSDPFALGSHRPDDGGSTYLWNVGSHSVKNTAVHPRRFWASTRRRENLKSHKTNTNLMNKGERRTAETVRSNGSIYFLERICDYEKETESLQNPNQASS